MQRVSQLDPSISIMTTGGIVIGCNNRLLASLGRTQDAVIGHCWKEWTLPTDLRRIERQLARYFAGKRTYFLSRWTRPDGVTLTGRVRVWLLQHGSKPLIVSMFRAEWVRSQILDQHSFKAAGLIRTTTMEMAVLAEMHGLRDVRDGLFEVALEASLVVNLSQAGDRDFLA